VDEADDVVFKAQLVSLRKGVVFNFDCVWIEVVTFAYFELLGLVDFTELCAH
jgi:hypothetical protein